MTHPYTDFPDLTPGDDIETIRKDLQAAQAHVMRELGSEATPESNAHYPPLQALDRLEGLLKQMRDNAAFMLNPGQTASGEDMLAEYRRLYTIEDMAKSLVVGRLRDYPEESMAGLWTNLVQAIDVDSPLHEKEDL